jgi:hypothetical protein
VEATFTEITVSWIPPTYHGTTPIIGYRLYWNAGSGDILKEIYFDTKNESIMKLTTLEGDVDHSNTYAFKVSAYNSVGEGLQSDIAEIRAPTPAPVDGVPTAPEI